MKNLLYRCAAWIVFVIASSASRAAFEPNYSDIWWVPTEPGWGLTIADHQTNLFVVWYAYRADGKPVWYTIPGGTLSPDKRFFTGDIYVTHGPSYTLDRFDASQVISRKVGTASFILSRRSVFFSYALGGVAGQKWLQRQSFGNAAPDWGVDFTDLWFRPAESGWGIALAQHGGNVFGVWYTYDSAGDPVWFVMPGVQFSSSSTFSGKLYAATGPYFANATFDPARVVVNEVGSASLSVVAISRADGDACDDASALASLSLPNVPSGPVQYERTLCPQAFGQARSFLQPKTCAGSYAAHCGTGAFSIDGVDWTKAGPQGGTIVLGPACSPLLGGSIPVTFNITQDSAGATASGFAGVDGPFDYDLSIAGNSVSGSLSMWPGIGFDEGAPGATFSCTVP